MAKQETVLFRIASRVSLAIVVTLGLLVTPSVVATDSAFGVNGACSGGVLPLGAGTTADPYLVATAANLIWISENQGTNPRGSANAADSILLKHYRQTANIDLAGCTWTPIGNNANEFGHTFSDRQASYDGGGFVIRGLKVVGGDQIGLFGHSRGTIRNVGIENASVSGGSSAGALVGLNLGDVFTSYSSGEVSSVPGKSANGGLIGVNNGVVENSYSVASVRATEGVGGLAGYHTTGAGGHIIKNSFAAGPVIPDPAPGGNIGGLFGANKDPLDLIAIGSNGTVVASFWDTQTTGQTAFVPAGAAGKTTAQMKDITTYTTAPAWDIVQGWAPFDPTGTPKRIWGICPQFNNGYPFLLWQASSDPCGSSATSSVVSPAIHLDLKAKVGTSVGGTQVLMEGQGLRPGSSYSLVVRSNPVTVKSGAVSQGGRFSHTLSMPEGIATGAHTITLTATGSGGQQLTLSQSFNVGSSGEFVALGPVLSQDARGLAATGPESSLVVGIGSLSLILLASGLALALARKRWATTDRV